MCPLLSTLFAYSTHLECLFPSAIANGQLHLKMKQIDEKPVSVATDVLTKQDPSLNGPITWKSFECCRNQSGQSKIRLLGPVADFQLGEIVQKSVKCCKISKHISECHC